MHRKLGVLWGFLVFIFVPILAMDGLSETTGFHCMTQYSMRLNRWLHGEPRPTQPPFDLTVLDEEGNEAAYYEPGKIYTIRLVGYVHYRGLLIQPRLCDEHGFTIGSLRGGRFLEDKNWGLYGLRFQRCSHWNMDDDSVTHADDDKKFLSVIKWTTDRDVGNVQFMITIASEDDVYWERWRPYSGFLQSISQKVSPSKVIKEVFVDEKSAFKIYSSSSDAKS
uniref:Reelin domain-containing protein n=1 Tax=Acrobeloides nanus TaxID=290746 RepID=A0A914EKS0_9BILA